jgi:secreted trypsin-like serine protease
MSLQFFCEVLRGLCKQNSSFCDPHVTNFRMTEQISSLKVCWKKNRDNLKMLNVSKLSSIWLYICCCLNGCKIISSEDSNLLPFSHSTASKNYRKLRKRSTQSIGARIIGGVPTIPSRYPYFTYLDISYRSNTGFCGGSLVAPDMVLTAAHCINPSNGVIFGIIAKVNYTQNTGYLTGYEHIRNVTRQILYPQYNLLQNSGDLALLLLNQPVIGIPMIKVNAASKSPNIGQSLTIIGFGDTSNGRLEFPKYLMEASVSTISQKVCNDVKSYDGKIIETDMICAGNMTSGAQDSCGGDSGGPLLIPGLSTSASDDIQVGISSFGEECGHPDFPGVYTRLSTYLPWIQDTICQNSQMKPSYCIKSRKPTKPRPTMKPKKPTRKPSRKLR